jgi:hypothetical protein
MPNALSPCVDVHRNTLFSTVFVVAFMFACRRPVLGRHSRAQLVRLSIASTKVSGNRATSQSSSSFPAPRKEPESPKRYGARFELPAQADIRVRPSPISDATAAKYLKKATMAERMGRNASLRVRATAALPVPLEKPEAKNGRRNSLPPTREDAEARAIEAAVAKYVFTADTGAPADASGGNSLDAATITKSEHEDLSIASSKVSGKRATSQSSSSLPAPRKESESPKHYGARFEFPAKVGIRVRPSPISDVTAKYLEAATIVERKGRNARSSKSLRASATAALPVPLEKPEAKNGRRNSRPPTREDVEARAIEAALAKYVFTADTGAPADASGGNSLLDAATITKSEHEGLTNDQLLDVLRECAVVLSKTPADPVASQVLLYHFHRVKLMKLAFSQLIMVAEAARFLPRDEIPTHELAQAFIHAIRQAREPVPLTVINFMMKAEEFLSPALRAVIGNIELFASASMQAQVYWMLYDKMVELGVKTGQLHLAAAKEIAANAVASPGQVRKLVPRLQRITATAAPNRPLPRAFIDEITVNCPALSAGLCASLHNTAPKQNAAMLPTQPWQQRTRRSPR